MLSIRCGLLLRIAHNHTACCVSVLLVLAGPRIPPREGAHARHAAVDIFNLIRKAAVAILPLAISTVAPADVAR